MASIRKLEGGKFRAEVARQGIRKSKVFPTKTAAKDWAARQEYLIVNAEQVQSSDTLASALDRYARERSPSKRGARWEIIRLEALARDSIGSIRLADLSPSDLSDWRDRRLAVVKPGSVIREMGLLSTVLIVCAKEWRLIKSNPMAEVRRPSAPPSRERRPSPDEMGRLALSAGSDLTNATARAFHAFLFAIETAMRAGEILSLRSVSVNTERRVAFLPVTKNGRPREVPLSSEAVRLLSALPDQEKLFDMDSRSLDALWRKLRDRAGVTGLTFHDSRHEAIMRLSKKMDVLALARTVGHRNIKQLLTYYHESAEDLAKLLD